MKQNRPEQKKYSPEVEEILARRSGFLVRNGIFLLAIFIALLLVTSIFITYPEQLKAPITFIQGSPDTEEIWGEIIVTADAGSLIKKDQPVSILILQDGHQTEEQFTGRVHEIEPINKGIYFKIYVTSLPENIPIGTEASAIIETSNTSLFHKILNPIFAIFRYD